MPKKLLVCTNYRANPNNPSCAARGSREILTAFTHQLQHENVPLIQGSWENCEALSAVTNAYIYEF